MSEPSKSSRREFLSGKSAVEAIGDAVIGPPPQLPLPQGLRPATRQLLSVSREAMACLFEVVFDAAQYKHAADVAIEALDLVALLEAQLTVYRETSEVQEINRRAAAQAVEVEPGLFDLLVRSQCRYVETSGAFDITAGPLSKVWGFYRRQGAMPSPAEIDAALALVGSDKLILDSEVRTVRFSLPGMELNLGACGKGYALDRAADLLVSSGVNDFLIHGGNSSVLARGRRDAAEAWSVALRHPLRPEVRLAEFLLSDQALGTSGSGSQFFHYQGKRYGHILDPRSGWPADQVLSATVIAPTAEAADALSTAFYVMGLEPAREYCAAHAELSALLISQSGSRIELHPLNLEAERWRSLL
jgi:thiamine biosynthesis lipoprotein